MRYWKYIKIWTFYRFLSTLKALSIANSDGVIGRGSNSDCRGVTYQLSTLSYIYYREESVDRKKNKICASINNFGYGIYVQSSNCWNTNWNFKFLKFKMEVKFAFRSAIVKIIYMFIRAILFKVESANYVKYSYWLLTY